MKKILATSLVTLLLVGCGESTDPMEPQLVASIEITPTSLSLAVHEWAELSAVARDVDGNSVSATLEWQSGNPNVASVSREGVVTGVSACFVLVTARNGEVTSNQVQVTVGGGSANSAESAACGG